MKRYIIYTIVMTFAVLQASAQTSVNYTYDNLNRLMEVSYSNGVKVKYTYDALGNRTKKTVTTSAITARGDVDGDGKVNIDDLTALINYLLSGDASAINLNNADCYSDGKLNIDDVTVLINYLLSGQW